MTILRRVLVALVLLALLIVPPAVLLTLGPRGLPDVDWDAMPNRLQAGDIPSELVIAVIAIVAWLAWISFVVSVIVEALAWYRATPSRALLVFPGAQRTAQHLIAGLLFSVQAVGGSTPDLAGIEARPVAASIANTEPWESADGPDAEPIADSADGSASVVATVRVSRSDSFMSLAERHLGDPSRWKELRSANIGAVMPDGTSITANSTSLVPGTVLRLPDGVAADTAEGPETVPEPVLDDRAAGDPAGGLPTGPDREQSRVRPGAGLASSIVPSVSDIGGGGRAAAKSEVIDLRDRAAAVDRDGTGPADSIAQATDDHATRDQGLDSRVPGAEATGIGRADTGPVDGGPLADGPPDTGLPDTGLPDTGLPDAGLPDAGLPDTGLPDVGPDEGGSAPSPVALDGDAAAPASTTVAPGDHFWAIAESTLEDAWGRTPTESETRSFWLDLVDLNASRLAPPADPDLIHPGQTFALPPVPEDPEVPAPMVVTRDDSGADDDGRAAPTLPTRFAPSAPASGAAEPAERLDSAPDDTGDGADDQPGAAAEAATTAARPAEGPSEPNRDTAPPHGSASSPDGPAMPDTVSEDADGPSRGRSDSIVPADGPAIAAGDDASDAQPVSPPGTSPVHGATPIPAPDVDHPDPMRADAPVPRAAASDTSDADGLEGDATGSMPWAVPAGVAVVGAVAAAGMRAALRRRQAHRRATRMPGTPVPPQPADEPRIARELAAVGSDAMRARIIHALAALADELGDDAIPFLVRVEADGRIEVALDRKLGRTPSLTSGWLRSEEQRPELSFWTFPATAVPARPATDDAAFPLLVGLGEGTWVNLTIEGWMTVNGPVDLVGSLVRFLAYDAVNSLRDDVVLRIGAPNLADVPRASMTDVRAEIERTIEAVDRRRRRSGDANARARVRPLLVVCTAMEFETLRPVVERLRRSPGRYPVAVVVTGAVIDAVCEAIVTAADVRFSTARFDGELQLVPAFMSDAQLQAVPEPVSRAAGLDVASLTADPSVHTDSTRATATAETTGDRGPTTRGHEVDDITGATAFADPMPTSPRDTAGGAQRMPVEAVDADLTVFPEGEDLAAELAAVPDTVDRGAPSNSDGTPAAVPVQLSPEPGAGFEIDLTDHPIASAVAPPATTSGVVAPVDTDAERVEPADDESPSVAPGLHIRVLGPVRITGIDEMSSFATAALTAVVTADEPLSVERLRDTIWPGGIGLRRAREVFSEMRSTAGQYVTLDELRGYSADATTDVDQFDALCASARSQSSAEAIVTLTDALDLVRGEPFEGFVGRAWEWVDGWERYRESLQFRIEDAFVALAHNAAAEQDWALVADAAGRGLRMNPLSEALTAVHVGALVRLGRSDQARKEIARWEEAFTREFGDEPGRTPSDAYDAARSALQPA